MMVVAPWSSALKRTVDRPFLLASVKPTSSGSSHQRVSCTTVSQNQIRIWSWRSSHSCSESLSTVSKVAMLALVDGLVMALFASQSLGWCKVHIPAPLVWCRHKYYFLPWKALMNALPSLPSVSLGGLFFHSHFSFIFFFCSFIILG